MQHDRFIPRILGATALALLFGGPAVHAAGTSADTSGQAHVNSAANSEATSGAPAQQQGASGGQATTGAQQAGVGQLNQQDQQILRDIAQSNLAEIRTSQLALERSRDPQIRQYAQRLLEDHNTLQERVAYLARVKDVQLPQQPSQAQQQTAQQLAQLQGDEFDRAYRKQMGVQAHQKTHEMLKSSQVQAQDPQLIALITQAMPVIQRHMTLAQNMPADQAGGAASGGQDQQGASAAGDATMTEGASEAPASGGTGSAVEGMSGAESISSPSGSGNMRGPGK